MRLWLIRHLPPAVPAGVCYGQTDLALQMPLAEQIDTLAALRKQLPIAAPVFSSPLARCVDLAIELSHAYSQDIRLQELNFGTWEMRRWEDIGPEALDAWASDVAGFRPPGGETGYELQRRVLDWLQEVSACHGEAIVVTHAGVIRTLQAHHQRLPGRQWLSLRYEYGQLVCLDFTINQIHATPVQ